MIMKKILSSFLVLLFVLFLSNNSNAQYVESSTKAEIDASIEQRAKLRNSSAFKNYPVRNVGPVVMSGRVSDIAVHPDNSRIFYVGYASGGVYKTTNSGNTMTPIFDHQDALGIGDIAISGANPNVIWVGTGENNSSRSSYAGAGVFKSIDAGETWTYTGLRNTQHIGRILTHPTNENIAWVGSVGALYSTNSERGVYKTTDGGKTWDKTLFVNDSTGVIDLVIHPTNPDILWAATWEKDRKAWNFKEGGNGSAVYKSTDGGETWSKSVDGLPQGNFVGRIGLDISQSNPDVIYAIVDNQFEMKEERENDSDALTQT
ncbi:MAG TPA: glycosyl hydrolase, partial [Balneola sp.]|nr:glycosyl hydrolase [Balneola sp.]